MGSMINQLTAQLALQACEGIMVERLNAQFPTRQFLPRWLKDVPETYDPAVNLFRPKVQQRSDSHKAKFCKEIEQIQTGLDMLGKTPRELAGLIDRAFACIAVNPGLAFANISECHTRLMCQYSNIFENCNLACKDENCTVCLAGEGDRHMPWQCWHPHYWGAPLYILFDLAVDYLNDKMYDSVLVKDVADTNIFLESLNAVLSPKYAPVKVNTATQEKPTQPNEHAPSTSLQESAPDESGEHDQLLKFPPEFRDMLLEKCVDEAIERQKQELKKLIFLRESHGEKFQFFMRHGISKSLDSSHVGDFRDNTRKLIRSIKLFSDESQQLKDPPVFKDGKAVYYRYDEVRAFIIWFCGRHGHDSAPVLAHAEKSTCKITIGKVIAWKLSTLKKSCRCKPLCRLGKFVKAWKSQV